MAIYIGSQKVIPHGIAKVYVGPNKVYEKSSYSTTLSDNTWDQIKEAIDGGLASSFGWLGQSKDGWQLVDLTAGRYSKYDGSGTTNAVFMKEGSTGGVYGSYDATNGANSRGYYGSSASTTLDSYYNNTLPSDIKAIVTRCYVKCKQLNNSTINNQAAYLFLPASVEVGTQSSSNEGTLLSYFQVGTSTEAKDLRKTNFGYYLRTPVSGYTSTGYSYYIKTDGTQGTNSSSYTTYYFRPCFAI